ncbi:hypothetical protein NM688_g6568 [Phlebia brevispora]|uniref:Uncharacterized protein n=1 Tax=Phlebia brevispora TaxID=194682 RepID=A0ACC1SEK3_9APHY|nr:hypothetical protein NM688_g6568 [Phlebia brevispora]
MVGRQDALLQAPTSPLRANIEGVGGLPEWFRLPSVEDVRKDVEQLETYLATDGPATDRAALASAETSEAVTSHRADVWTNHAVTGMSAERWQWSEGTPELDNLFLFARFCNPSDVPKDLMEPVIWALKIAHRMISECADEQLGEYAAHADTFRSYYVRLFKYPIDHAVLIYFSAVLQRTTKLTNARIKLNKLLLNPSIDRPSEAIPYLEAAVEHDARRLQAGKGPQSASVEDQRQYRDRPWMCSPILYVFYSHARALSGLFDDRTKAALQHTIDACDLAQERRRDAAYLGMIYRGSVQARIDLAQVLKQMGVERGLWGQHADWSARFLRKNPAFIPPAELVQMLGRPDQATHPVLERLGGDAWLRKHIPAAMARSRGLAGHLSRPHLQTPPTDRLTAEMDVLTWSVKRLTLKQAERAAVAYYWYAISALDFVCGLLNGITAPKIAREQTGAVISTVFAYLGGYGLLLPLVRFSCRAHNARLARISKLELTDPFAAQRARDWMRWRGFLHEGNYDTVIDTLGLRRDVSRGGTHIVIYQVEYAPTTRLGKEKDLRDRFQVVRAGVFRLDDACEFIEITMGIFDGGLRRDFSDEVAWENAQGLVPIFSYVVGYGIPSWIGQMAISVDSLHLSKHTAEWRKRFNRDGNPVEPLRLPNGIQDAEFDS